MLIAPADALRAERRSLWKGVPLAPFFGGVALLAAFVAVFRPRGWK